jgi:hypothetical protein
MFTPIYTPIRANYVRANNVRLYSAMDTDLDKELKDKRNKASRFRQHVNPLSRKYQASAVG